MGAALLTLLTLAISLALLLAASELMVHQLRVIGEHLGLTPGMLGLVVALGADAPEISTAIFALAAGSQQIGLGVVEGSNIYNLAGLLGLSGLLAGPLIVTRRQIMHDGAGNLALTCLMVLLLLAAGLRTWFALLVLLVFAIYGWTVVRQAKHARIQGHVARPLILALVAMAAVIGMSALLAHSAIELVHQLHIPEAIIGVFILPISTSLPNTWAALSLARRGLGDALASATFNSNSINLAFGIAVPSLLLHLHPTFIERVLDGPYLLGMTVVTIVLLLSNNRFTRREGMVVVGLYLAFVVVRVVTMR